VCAPHDGSVEVRDLPDPSDRSLAWWQDEPSYLAWWRRLRGREDTWRQVSTFRLYEQYSEAIPNLDALNALLDLGPLLEIGSGTGYWARLLRDLGSDVIASDVADSDLRRWSTRTATPWTEMVTSDHRIALQYPTRTLFVCWPPRPNGFVPELLNIAPQTLLALITDGPSSLGTHVDPLYTLLARDWHLLRRVATPTWPYRTDGLMLWQRR
jgi:hypothetical protein